MEVISWPSGDPVTNQGTMLAEGSGLVGPLIDFVSLESKSSSDMLEIQNFRQALNTL